MTVDQVLSLRFGSRQLGPRKHPMQRRLDADTTTNGCASEDQRIPSHQIGDPLNIAALHEQLMLHLQQDRRSPDGHHVLHPGHQALN